jgi:predicted CopG family antitoxin
MIRSRVPARPTNPYPTWTAPSGLNPFPPGRGGISQESSAGAEANERPQGVLGFCPSRKCVGIDPSRTVKTVTPTKEAYDALAPLHAEGESFSDVIRRPSRSRVPLSSFAGARRETPTEQVREVRRFPRAYDRHSLARLRLERSPRQPFRPLEGAGSGVGRTRRGSSTACRAVVGEPGARRP